MFIISENTECFNLPCSFGTHSQCKHKYRYQVHATKKASCNRMYFHITETEINVQNQVNDFPMFNVPMQLCMYLLLHLQ